MGMDGSFSHGPTEPEFPGLSSRGSNQGHLADVGVGPMIVISKENRGVDNM